MIYPGRAPIAILCPVTPLSQSGPQMKWSLVNFGLTPAVGDKIRATYIIEQGRDQPFEGRDEALKRCPLSNGPALAASPLGLARSCEPEHCRLVAWKWLPREVKEQKDGSRASFQPPQRPSYILQQTPDSRRRLPTKRRFRSNQSKRSRMDRKDAAAYQWRIATDLLPFVSGVNNLTAHPCCA